MSDVDCVAFTGHSMVWCPKMRLECQKLLSTVALHYALVNESFCFPFKGETFLKALKTSTCIWPEKGVILSEALQLFFQVWNPRHLCLNILHDGNVFLLDGKTPLQLLPKCEMKNQRREIPTLCIKRGMKALKINKLRAQIDGSTRILMQTNNDNKILAGKARAYFLQKVEERDIRGKQKEKEVIAVQLHCTEIREHVNQKRSNTEIFSRQSLL